MVSDLTNKYREWIKRGVPAVLIPGIIFASIYGIKNLNKLTNYYGNEKIFHTSGIVEDVEDGDTFVLDMGQSVRMVGINAPDRSAKTDRDEVATDQLTKVIMGKRVWLEYDRYQDDKYGRILAWVWINCENEKPKFTDANYMHLSGNESREYLVDNPEGCKNGELINRKMVEGGYAEVVEYKKRGRLKYKL